MTWTPASKPWGKAEDATLREYYPSMGKAVRLKLPGRTDFAIKGRAARLELKVITLPTVVAETVNVKKISGVVPPTRKERIEDLEKIIAASERIDAGSIYVRVCRERLKELGAA